MKAIFTQSPRGCLILRAKWAIPIFLFISIIIEDHFQRIYVWTTEISKEYFNQTWDKLRKLKDLSYNHRFKQDSKSLELEVVEKLLKRRNFIDLFETYGSANLRFSYRAREKKTKYESCSNPNPIVQIKLEVINHTTENYKLFLLTAYTNVLSFLAFFHV